MRVCVCVTIPFCFNMRETHNLYCATMFLANCQVNPRLSAAHSADNIRTGPVDAVCRKDLPRMSYFSFDRLELFTPQADLQVPTDRPVMALSGSFLGSSKLLRASAQAEVCTRRSKGSQPIAGLGDDFKKMFDSMVALSSRISCLFRTICVRIKAGRFDCTAMSKRR